MKLGPDRSNILLYKSTVIFAFLWSYYWNHPFTAKVSGIYGRQAIPRHDLFRIIPPSLFPSGDICHAKGGIDELYI